MKNTKFLKIIEKISDTEALEFQNWLYSPFHNKNENLRQIYDWLLEMKTIEARRGAKKSLIFKKIYPKEAYNELKINNLISQLTRQLFDFLAFYNFKNSNTLASLCLIDELLDRDLNKMMLQEAKKLAKKKSQSIINNSSTFFETYLHYKQLDEYFLKQPKRVYDENLQLKNDNLDLFYLATKLKIACDMVSRNTVIQANYQMSHLAILEELLVTNEVYLAQPAIAVYYQAYKTIKSGMAEDYQRLKQLLVEHFSVFPNAELSRIYDYILNFCIRQINQGNGYFYKEILEHYKFLLDNRIIFQNGYLAQWDYKNIITVGARIGDIVWTENFINEYKDFLPPQDRENAFIYNKAAFYYSIKAYKKSLQLLHEVKFTDTSYHLGAKIIQLKSFYELEESEPFYALISAFKIYVLRSEDLSSYRKQANLNLIKYAKRIFQLKESRPFLSPSIYAQKWKSINEALKKTENIANKSWLENCFERL